MSEPLIDLLILLAFLTIPYIGWKAYRQYQEEKEKKADVNRQLFMLTQPMATAEEIIDTTEKLLVGLNYSFKPWVNPEYLGHVHGRLLAIKEVAGTDNVMTETMIEDLARRLKQFDVDYRHGYIVGLSKIKAKYGAILQACL